MIRISAIPDTLLTCQLEDVSILTDHLYLNVEFATATEVLLSGKFYATNSSVSLSDLRSLAELAIKATGFSVEKFYVRAVYDDEVAEAAFTAVYCDRDIYDVEVLRCVKKIIEMSAFGEIAIIAFMVVLPLRKVVNLTLQPSCKRFMLILR